MGLPLSEGSTGLDVQDDTLTLLALDTGCHLGVPSGTVNQISYRCLSSIGVVEFLTGGLTYTPEQASQGTRLKLHSFSRLSFRSHVAPLPPHSICGSHSRSRVEDTDLTSPCKEWQGYTVD